MKKKIKNIIIFSLLVSVFLGSYFFFKLKSQPLNTNSNLTKIEIGKIKILVEVADTSEKRGKGLSNRDFLPENQGMLFIFSEPDFYSFWMKEMKFPLDFIWIRENRVVEITENIKPEDFQPPKSFTSKEKFDKVLEVNAGFVKKFNIKIGDRINF